MQSDIKNEPQRVSEGQIIAANTNFLKLVFIHFLKKFDGTWL